MNDFISKHTFSGSQLCASHDWQVMAPNMYNRHFSVFYFGHSCETIFFWTGIFLGEGEGAGVSSPPLEVAFPPEMENQQSQRTTHAPQAPPEF